MILLNPEIVVLGGSVFELPGAEELLARPLMDEILRNYPFEPAILKRTALGSRASVIGALQYALDSLLVHAHPYRLCRLPRAAPGRIRLGDHPREPPPR